MRCVLNDRLVMLALRILLWVTVLALDTVAVCFLFLSCLVLRLDEVVLVVQLLVELAADPRELEVKGNFPVVEARAYFLLKDNKFVFHLGVDVPLFVGGPETPEGVGNHVAVLCLLLDTENVGSEFLKDVLALHELLFLLHLRLHHMLVHLVFRRGYVLA